MLAPICLFVYNRPKHTLKTLEALSKNDLAKESKLYIFSDGPKLDCSPEEKGKIVAVRNILRQKEWCESVIIYESKNNKGLANSVIDGVSKIIKEHGKIIVLEDDLLTCRYFLSYMNTALETYKDNNNVKQISGYSYPVKTIDNKKSCYFLPITNTWGWGSWSRVWNEVNFDCKDYNEVIINKKEKYKFNFFGTYNFTKLLKQQMLNKKVSSWGIRFYYNVFLNRGIVLYPDYSMVKNIGWDNSGRHGASFELYKHEKWDAEYEITIFPKPNIEDNFLKENISYLKRENNLLRKMIRKIVSFLKST